MYFGYTSSDSNSRTFNAPDSQNCTSIVCKGLKMSDVALKSESELAHRINRCKNCSANLYNTAMSIGFTSVRIISEKREDAKARIHNIGSQPPT